MAIVSGGGGGGASLPTYFSVSSSAPAGKFVVNADGGVMIQQATDTVSGGTLELKELTGQGSAMLQLTKADGSGIGYIDGPEAAGSPLFNFSGRIRATLGIAAAVINSGALPTVAPVSGTAFQLSGTRDVFLAVPFTGDATNNAATLKIELSPDDTTYSILDTLSIAAALNLTGAINVPVTVAVPVAWYVKLTAVHGTIGTSTYY